MHNDVNNCVLLQNGRVTLTLQSPPGPRGSLRLSHTRWMSQGGFMTSIVDFIRLRACKSERQMESYALARYALLRAVTTCQCQNRPHSPNQQDCKLFSLYPFRCSYSSSAQYKWSARSCASVEVACAFDNQPTTCCWLSVESARHYGKNSMLMKIVQILTFLMLCLTSAWIKEP